MGVARACQQLISCPSCDSVRSCACVGFCVALRHTSAYSRGERRLFSILLGELWFFLTVAARGRRRSQVLLLHTLFKRPASRSRESHMPGVMIASP
jgi:hypothetical protein